LATSTWKNAPVSGGSSHGGVLSHALRRTTTPPSLIDWPGRILTSLVTPFCLLRMAMVATRCAMGVSSVDPGRLCPCEAIPADEVAVAAADAAGDAFGACVALALLSPSCCWPGAALVWTSATSAAGNRKK